MNTMTYCSFCYNKSIYTVCDDCIVDNVKDIEFGYDGYYMIEKDSRGSYVDFE